MFELIVTDLAGAEQGTIRGAVADREFTPAPLRSVPTGKFSVRADNEKLPWLAQTDRCLVKVLRTTDNLLLMNGPVVGFEKTRDESGGSVSIAIAGAAWRTQGRLIGKSPTGSSYGTPTAQIGRQEAMGLILDEMNADRSTGIRRGTLTPCAPGYFGPWFYKPGLEAWQEIAAPLDGPDWQIAPLDIATTGYIGELNAAPAFGADKPNALWEFGTGKANVKSWRHVINPGTMANRAINLPPGFPDNVLDGQAPQQWDDATSQSVHGLYETTIAADLSSDPMRLKLVQQQVAFRAEPAQIIDFTPRMEIAGDLVYGTDYSEGDLIRFHAQEDFPIVDVETGKRVGTQSIDTVDGIFRIYAVTLAADPEGNVTPSFTIIGGDA